MRARSGRSMRVANMTSRCTKLAKVYARSIYDEFTWVEMVIVPRETIISVIES